MVKRYGTLEVMHGIDLAIGDGEFVVFVGPSGCGKSTLLRMIAGLEDIRRARSSSAARVVNELPPRARDIAMVFQDYALYPHKSVFENMAFGLRLRKRPSTRSRRACGEAAAILQIDASARAQAARAVGRPAPARRDGARDRPPAARRSCSTSRCPISMRCCAPRCASRSRSCTRSSANTIIYVTHDQVEAMTLADRIVVLQAGTSAVRHARRHLSIAGEQFVAGFIGSPPMNFLPARFEGADTLQIGEGVWSNGEGPAARATMSFSGADRKTSASPSALRRLVRTDLPATVEVVEPLGSDTLVFTSVFGASVTARVRPKERPAPGSKSGSG